MTQKKMNISTEIEEEQEETKDNDSPKYKELEELPIEEEDLPYFYVDKPVIIFFITIFFL